MKANLEEKKKEKKRKKKTCILSSEGPNFFYGMVFVLQLKGR